MKLHKKILKPSTPSKQSVSAIVEEIKADKEKRTKKIYIPIATDSVISTGSTLLDLAISGGRIKGGGLPGGILMEISGPSASGKTALAVEIGTSAQQKGGGVNIADPEARLDMEYTRIYGLDLVKENYTRPDTVTELFEDIQKWHPENEDVINVYIADSIAALSTEMEMGEGDKRGQRKAKELHEGTRKTARLIAKGHKLIVFTNQERQGEYGKTTPGGLAVGYFSSVRIRIVQKKKIEVLKKYKGKVVKKIIGILSEATITKSSVDDEYRTAPIYLIFGVGLDDVRANLQYLKDMNKDTKYMVTEDNGIVSLEKAVRYIEDNELEGALRERVITVWEDVEELFKTTRKTKKRF